MIIDSYKKRVAMLKAEAYKVAPDEIAKCIEKLKDQSKIYEKTVLLDDGTLGIIKNNVPVSEMLNKTVTVTLQDENNKTLQKTGVVCFVLKDIEE